MEILIYSLKQYNPFASETGFTRLNYPVHPVILSNYSERITQDAIRINPQITQIKKNEMKASICLGIVNML